MARKSFIERIQPNRMRSKTIPWPFAAEGGGAPLEAPRVRMRVLGAHELEAANLATADYFLAIKKKVASREGAFLAREHVELVWRAFVDEDGEPLMPSAAELAKEPAEIIQPLYDEWSAFQAQVAVSPLKQTDLDDLIEDLKKNTHGGLLDALPSIWLRQLLLTLVSQPETSTTANERG